MTGENQRLQLVSTKSMTCLEKECNAELRTSAELRLHLIKVHGETKYEEIEHQFSSLVEAMAWRDEMEHNSPYRYTMAWSRAQKSGQKCVTVKVLQCSRQSASRYSPKPASVRQRQMKSQGLTGCGHLCPAFIRIRHDDEAQKTVVTACLQHYGHDADLTKVRLSALDRHLLRAKLKAGISARVITAQLADQKTNQKQPQRRSDLIQPRDVRNARSAVAVPPRDRRNAQSVVAVPPRDRRNAQSAVAVSPRDRRNALSAVAVPPRDRRNAQTAVAVSPRDRRNTQSVVAVPPRDRRNAQSAVAARPHDRSNTQSGVAVPPRDMRNSQSAADVRPHDMWNTRLAVVANTVVRHSNGDFELEKEDSVDSDDGAFEQDSESAADVRPHDMWNTQLAVTATEVVRHSNGDFKVEKEDSVDSDDGAFEQHSERTSEQELALSRRQLRVRMLRLLPRIEHLTAADAASWSQCLDVMEAVSRIGS